MSQVLVTTYRDHFTRLRNRAVGVVGVLIVAIASMLAAPGSASAAINWPSQWSHTWANGGWVNVRACTSIPACGVNFSLYGYNPVKMLCWTNGTYAYGTAKWFYVYAAANGRYGYVNANLVTDQVWSPAC